jgi:hypothetical protein
LHQSGKGAPEPINEARPNAAGSMTKISVNASALRLIVVPQNFRAVSGILTAHLHD